MDRPKLKLKEQPPASHESMAWLQGHRYAKPKPPSVVDRLGGAIKRAVPFILFLAVSVTAFLLVPFRQWDDFDIWRQLNDDIALLESQIDSLPNLQRALATANEAGLLWREPNGSCPAKWYQRAQQRKYEASFGITQSLALGIIHHGKTDRGLGELENLRQRTGLNSLPPLPDTQNLVTPCPLCKKGTLSTKCAECGGKKTCKRCNGQGTLTFPNSQSSFPLTASLGGTRLPAKRLGKDTPIHHNCSTCQGSGKCPSCGGEGSRSNTCPKCKGQTRLIDYPSIPLLYKESLTRTQVLVKNEMEIKKIIHKLANVQRSLLLKGASAGRNILSTANIDISFNGSEEDPGLSSKPHTTEDLRSGEKGQTLIAQDTPEAHLLKACETLLQKPLSIPDLTTLATVARTATNNPALQSRSMAAFSLAHLLQSNTNNFARASRILASTYPNETSLLTVTEADFIATCDACLGRGNKETPCPQCMGPNKCPVCKGTGETVAGNGFVPCEACKNKGVCSMCKGQRHMTISCTPCNGNGKLIVPGDAVRNNYNRLLNGMIAICTENSQFADQFARAVAEKDCASRIRLLQTITNNFPKQPGQEQATALLDAALKEHARVTNTLEDSTAPNGLSGDMGQGQGAAPFTKKPQKTGLLGLGAGTLAIIALLSLVARTQLKKKQPRRLSSLPGMRNVNANDFTDPLTLTAKDSRSQRAKQPEDI